MIKQQVDRLVLAYRSPRHSLPVGHGAERLSVVEVIEPDMRVDAVALRPDQDADWVELFGRSEDADVHTRLRLLTATESGVFPVSALVYGCTWIIIWFRVQLWGSALKF